MKTQTNKGITLISLVITVIILIILLGVVLNGVINEGFIEKSTTAADQYGLKSEKEQDKTNEVINYLDEANTINISTEAELIEFITNSEKYGTNSILLTDDIELTARLGITKNLIINLNNKTLTGSIELGLRNPAEGEKPLEFRIKNGTLETHFMLFNCEAEILNCKVNTKHPGTSGSFECRGKYQNVSFKRCDINFKTAGDYGFGLEGVTTVNLVESDVLISDKIGVFLWAGYGDYKETDDVKLNIDDCKITNNQWWGTERWCCTYSINTWHDELEVTIRDSEFYGKVGGVIDAYVKPGETKVVNPDGSVFVK